MHFSLLLLSLSLPRIFAHYHNDAAYDKGAFGEAPVQKYVSSTIESPVLNILRHSAECDDGLYTFLSPRGGAVKEAGAMILDERGDLIWWGGGWNQVYDVKPQMWHGKQYLTFWAGDDAVGGHGAGMYYMLDSSYKEVFKFGALNGLDGDLHDFRITLQGTVMVTIYEVIPSDLISLGRSSDGYIWDCLFQEFTLGRNRKLLFQWRASEHYTVTDSYRQIGDDDGTKDAPWDWFHINSVEKDEEGNYLISSRYTHSLTYISGQDGHILWILGGRRNNFKDLSSSSSSNGGGKATTFFFQHDARFLDANTVTLFDNDAMDGNLVGAHSRGMKVRLNYKAMTASLVAEYVNPNHIHGVSQGSMQTLESGNVVVGFGNAGAWTEFKGDGTVLCDIHFGPSSRFGSGDIQSYRVSKHAWHGTPSTLPSLAFSPSSSSSSNNSPKTQNANPQIHVSWNGATEIKTWLLQGSSSSPSSFSPINRLRIKQWHDIAQRNKTGFETVFDLESSSEVPQKIRVLALDAAGKILGTSAVVQTDVSPSSDSNDTSAIVLSSTEPPGLLDGVTLLTKQYYEHPSWFRGFWLCFFVLGSVFGVREYRSWRRRGREKLGRGLGIGEEGRRLD